MSETAPTPRRGRWQVIGAWVVTALLVMTANIGAGLFPPLCYWQGRLRTLRSDMTPMAWSPDHAPAHVSMATWAAGWIVAWALHVLWVGRLRLNVAHAIVPMGVMLGLGWQELRLAYACNIF